VLLLIPIIQQTYSEKFNVKALPGITMKAFMLTRSKVGKTSIIKFPSNVHNFTFKNKKCRVICSSTVGGNFKDLLQESVSVREDYYSNKCIFIG